MSVIIDFSIFPLSANKESLSPYVARAINIIKSSGLTYALGPMGTAIEGEWDEVMKVVDDCYRELEPEFDRIYINIKVDSKKDRTNGIQGKVSSVIEKSS